MPPELKPYHPPEEMNRPRRSAWRQRLVDAERGVTQGLRTDSTFYVHFFITSVVLATAVVLGISHLEWGVVLLAITLVLAAEMFNHVIKVILNGMGHHFERHSQQVLRVGTAAVFVCMIGSTISVGIIIGRHLWNLFG